jgi:hypothetical protein
MGNNGPKLFSYRSLGLRIPLKLLVLLITCSLSFESLDKLHRVIMDLDNDDDVMHVFVLLRGRTIDDDVNDDDGTTNVVRE